MVADEKVAGKDLHSPVNGLIASPGLHACRAGGERDATSGAGLDVVVVGNSRGIGRMTRLPLLFSSPDPVTFRRMDTHCPVI